MMLKTIKNCLFHKKHFRKSLFILIYIETLKLEEKELLLDIKKIKKSNQNFCRLDLMMKIILDNFRMIILQLLFYKDFKTILMIYKEKQNFNENSCS